MALDAAFIEFGAVLLSCVAHGRRGSGCEHTAIAHRAANFLLIAGALRTDAKIAHKWLEKRLEWQESWLESRPELSLSSWMEVRGRWAEALRDRVRAARTFRGLAGGGSRVNAHLASNHVPVADPGLDIDPATYRRVLKAAQPADRQYYVLSRRYLARRPGATLGEAYAAVARRFGVSQSRVRSARSRIARLAAEG